MRMLGVALMGLVMVLSWAGIGIAAGPSDERFRMVFQELRAAMDANKDGTLTVAECQAVYTDPKVADRNCRFWDANHDGIMTEDEYVSQVRALGKK